MKSFSEVTLYEFIEVEVLMPDGTLRRLYGGDQAWFQALNGRLGGCGTVAAANILAYFGVVLPACSDPESSKSGPVIPRRLFTKDEFQLHMENTYTHLKPLEAPWRRQQGGLSKSMRRLRPPERTKPFQKSVQPPKPAIRLPESLGIHSPRRFANGVVCLADHHHVPLTTVWPTRDHGRVPTSLQLNATQAGKFIETQISEGFPVAMLNFANTGLRQIPYTDLVTGQTCLTDHFQWHWVVLTGCQIKATSPKMPHHMLTMTTWGNRATLELESFWGRGLTHLVSFRPE